MKLVGLLVTLGIIAMLALTLMLATISADASAQLSSVGDGSSHDTNSALVPTPANTALQNVVPLVTPSDAPSVQTDTQVINARKRTNSRCARVTATCWGSD